MLTRTLSLSDFDHIVAVFDKWWGGRRARVAVEHGSSLHAGPLAQELRRLAEPCPQARRLGVEGATLVLPPTAQGGRGFQCTLCGAYWEMNMAGNMQRRGTDDVLREFPELAARDGGPGGS